MKTPITFKKKSLVPSLALGLVVVGMSPFVRAADDTWNVDADGSWATVTNWLSGTQAPGSTSSTTNTDTATFGNIISTARVITVDANRNIFGINFDGNSSGYTLSSGNLLLTAGGTIQTSGAGSVHTDTVNAPITLEGNYTFGTNSSTTGRILAFGSAATITSAATGTTTLTLNGTGTSNSNAIAGIISNGTGTVAVSKSGAGTWVLSGANTFSGGTTVSAGTLLVGSAAGAGTGTLTLSGGTFGALGAQTITNTVSATAATTTTLQGTGTLNLNGALTGSGTLNIGSAGVALGNVAVNSTNSSNSTGFTGTLSVGGVLGFNSPSSSNGADYYYNLSNAAMTLTSGGSTQWNAGNGSAANNPGVLYVNLGSLSSASGIGTIGTVSGGSANTKMSRYVVGTLNTDTTFGGVIASGGNLGTSLVKVGTGTLILTGTNTYAGTAAFGSFGALPATTIRGGTLQVGDGTSGSLATGALTFLDTGKFNYQGQTAGSSQTLGALTFSQGAGTVQSTYGTSGNTLLTFASQARTAGATGNFVISGGTNGSTNMIVFTSAPTAGALINQGYYFGGSEFAAYDSTGYVRALAYGTDTSSAAVDTITAANNVKLTATPGAQNTISLLTLNLAGSGVSWTNNASQTLTLSSGGLIKSGGGTVGVISGGTAITTGGATELVIRTDTSSDLLDIQTNITSATTGGLTKTGAGTLTLSSSANAYTGATRVNEGTLTISGTYSGSSAFTVNNNATLTVTGTVTSTAASPAMTVGNGSGNGVLNVNSGGTLNLNIASGNTGLQISNSSTGYDTASGTVNVAGTLNTNGDVYAGLGGTQSGTLNINNGGIVNMGTTTLRWLQIGSFDESNGVVNIATGGTLNLGFNSDLRFSTNNGSGTSVVNQNGGNVTVWSGNGTGTTGSSTDGLVDMQSGTGSLGNNTYNLNGGTLLVNQVKSSGTTATRTFNFNGGTLKAFSASAATFFNIGSGNARANVRNGGAIIDTNGFSVTVSQALLHSNVSGDNATDGGLIKNSTGTLTLTGTNTFNGATKVNGGTLALGNVNAIQNSPLDVTGAGAVTFTVGGTNTYNLGGLKNSAGTGAVGTTLAAGANSITLGSTAVSSIAIASLSDFNSAAAIAVTTSGSFTLGGALNVTFANTFASGSVAAFNLFDGNNAGTFAFVNILGSYSGTLNSGNGYAFTDVFGNTFSFNNSTGVFNISAVPEPHEYAIAMAGLLCMVVILRRRRMSA